VGVLSGSSPVSIFLVVITLTTGVMLTMWLVELISQRGLGNGISLIITVSILSQAPSAIRSLLEDGNVRNIVILGLLTVLIVATVVHAPAYLPFGVGYRDAPLPIVDEDQSGETYLPLNVNMAGDTPIIFASTLLLFPIVLAHLFAGGNQDSILSRIAAFFSPGNTPYLIFYALLIVMFTYFYTAVQFNPIEHADSLKKSGGYVPGYRPGQPTAIYLNNVLTRITLVGAVFLALVAVVPYLITGIMNLPQSIFLGGTSMLIVVGVSLDTMRQIEYLMSRNYEGFFGDYALGIHHQSHLEAVDPLGLGGASSEARLAGKQPLARSPHPHDGRDEGRVHHAVDGR
jgi:preprotein translocase subunit SecY